MSPHDRLEGCFADINIGFGLSQVSLSLEYTRAGLGYVGFRQIALALARARGFQLTAKELEIVPAEGDDLPIPDDVHICGYRIEQDSLFAIM